MLARGSEALVSDFATAIAHQRHCFHPTTPKIYHLHPTKTLDAHTPVVQFFASKKHHEILFHGNKLDRITGRMMDDEIKRRQLKVRCCLVGNAHWDMRGRASCWSLPISSSLPLPSPPIHLAHGSARA